MDDAEWRHREYSSCDRLDGLTIWLVGSSELQARTSQVCHVTAIAVGENWLPLSGSDCPAFLLVEGTEALEEDAGDWLRQLLDASKKAEVPSLLWITATPCDPQFLKLCPRFSRVFSADRGQLPELRAAGAASPALLWPGAIASPATVPSGDERPNPVLWPGGWRDAWPRRWRERLVAVLDSASAFGLRILGEDGADPLPSRLASRVQPPGEVGDDLLESRVVIASHPTSPSLHIAPPVAFDAMACGATVVSPHEFTRVFDFSQGKWLQSSWRELIPTLNGSESATAEIGRLLGDRAYLTDTAKLCTRIARLNHTHSHRIATLASAIGIKTIPNVP